MMKPVDCLIEPRWIVPVESAGVLEQHALIIDRGCIAAILPSALAHEAYAPRKRVRLPDHALIPGLVNLHTHAAMSLLRGYADDIALMDWLQQRIWPVELRTSTATWNREGFAQCAAILNAGRELVGSGSNMVQANGPESRSSQR